ncbi:MAG: histidine--tRNA ligase [bacterium]|nr:histidine--tRNA ligase [bacterium]
MQAQNDILGRKVQNYTGTRDFFGEEARWRNWVIDQIRSSFQAFGFEPLETPMIETDRTLKGKYGQEGEMRRFKLSLKAPNEAGLRYDHTVPLARFMAMRWSNFPMPYRRYAIGPVFRHESVQAGRLRQFTQCDFDTVGSGSSVIDAEVVAMNYFVLTKLGFKDNFTVRINDRRLLNAMASAMGFSDTEDVLSLFRGWDKMEKTDRKTVEAELIAEGIDSERVKRFGKVTDSLLAISGSSADKVFGIINKTFDSKKVLAEIKKLEEIVNYITAMGVPEEYFRVWPLLARGLDYYTGPIFETIVETAGIGSITGGGRFDNLIQQMGGPDMPASGSSFGLERVMGVMEQIGLKPKSSQTTQVFMTLFDQESLSLCETSFKVVAALRHKGVAVEVYTGEGQKMAKQLDIANRKSIPLVLILGPDEYKSGKVAIKDLRSIKRIAGGQISVPLGEIAKQIIKLLD